MLSFDHVNSVPRGSETSPSLSDAIQSSQKLLLSHQSSEGYWWYALEANETIGSGAIQLAHSLDCVDPNNQTKLLNHLLTQQRDDGSWALYYGAPGDLSITVEAYLALRLGGYSTKEAPLVRAREFILKNGGISKIRIFTRIHLALFGLVPWEACPAMPTWLISLPPWSGFSIYEFSSWARASIVPLLVVMDKKPIRPVPFDLNELSARELTDEDWALSSKKGSFSWEKFFIRSDKFLKILGRLPWHPGKQKSLDACEKWIREHLERTEDIYPALAYGAMALAALGYPNEDRHIQKALKALRKFQQPYSDNTIPALSQSDNKSLDIAEKIHQQCCISPLWDTPWAMTALLNSGCAEEDPALQKAARYLIDKQITKMRGDWAIKNSRAEPGGWAFEFENDYFPDIDDTIQIIEVLQQIELPEGKKEEAILRGLSWLLSMQSSNGGWGAFDRNNTADWVNRIPFSDHGACLDPPTPDITGRAIGLLAGFGYTLESRVIRRAIRFLKKEQCSSNSFDLKPDEATTRYGAWKGRWGVNYIYGTWSVLQGLAPFGFDRNHPMIKPSVRWLKEIQLNDGGWGESCDGYLKNRLVALDHGVPSQTAWALMALMAIGETKSATVKRGISFLLERQRHDGGWDEPEFTGTGFPGHFFIRYHGYRHFFPLMALGQYLEKP